MNPHARPRRKPPPAPIDHDQIYKLLWEAFFREAMELFCPAEAELIDFGQVEFLREEFFTDVRSGKRRRLDLVAKVGLKKGGQYWGDAKFGLTES
ncbi:MAG: hypothetical protein ACKV2Q_12180 [Planctomycetaceae bacterium]